MEEKMERAEVPLQPEQAVKLWKILSSIRQPVIRTEKVARGFLQLIWSMVSEDKLRFPFWDDPKKGNHLGFMEEICSYDCFSSLDMASADPYYLMDWFSNPGEVSYAIYRIGTEIDYWTENFTSTELFERIRETLPDEILEEGYEVEDARVLDSLLDQCIISSRDPDSFKNEKELMPELYGLYRCVCDIIPRFEGKESSFIKSLPALFILLGDPQMNFYVNGLNPEKENAIGNAELDSFYIEGAGWLVPLLENQGDEEIKILKWCLEQLTRGFVYSTSDILNSLPTITVRDGHLYFECLDVQWNDYSEDKQVDTSRLFPSAAMFFVPYIWKSLYPIVKERYHGNMEDEREVNLHGQAA